MLTTIALLASIILQFVAMSFAISLIRSTRYNSSWILLSIGLMIMAGRRLLEFLPFVGFELSSQLSALNNWLGVLVSLLMVVGIFYIRKIFQHLKNMEKMRHQAEQRVLNAIIFTEENERKRLAKDLHDGLGPLLSTAKMSVSAIRSSEMDEPHRVIYKNAILAIEESISSLKEISNNLSPHILNNFGLCKAVRSFAEKIEQTGKISIDFSSNLDDKRFETNVEVILYRSICELIVNTVNHAKAHKILIGLDLEGSTLKLNYLDDGKGFRFKEVLDGKTTGMGLSNIRSRIASLKGSFEMDSWPNEGIIVTICIKV
ncbi:MAG: sensor histidine kinase [Bacteroidales bacterium]|nr:sensor histidine kinase [Bacteroidales bacterium]